MESKKVDNTFFLNEWGFVELLKILRKDSEAAA